MPADAVPTAALPLPTTEVDARRTERLRSARLYLCTDARQAHGDLEPFLHAVLSGGVDVVQLRQKGMEAGDELRCLELVARVAAQYDALVSVNDRADVARAAGSDVLHLGQDDLPLAVARAVVGDTALIGLSTHDRGQVDGALGEPGLDYFCVGPTWPTPTKPGRPASGIELVRYAANRAGDLPWFAIGGIDLDTLGQVLDAGARRVVVVRALTQAGEGAQAVARQLSRRLQEQ